jgi:hypothetical protein
MTLHRKKTVCSEMLRRVSELENTFGYLNFSAFYICLHNFLRKRRDKIERTPGCYNSCNHLRTVCHFLFLKTLNEDAKAVDMLE